MSELFSTLGIDWKLLLAQAANFLVILVVLRLTVYKPLVNLLHERKKKIEQGLKDAEAAGERLDGIEKLERERLAEAEKEAIKILAKSEESGKEKELEIVKAAKAKEGDILEAAEKAARANQEEAKEAVFQEAAALVKSAIVKTVSAKPEQVDESLIGEAIGELRKTAK